MNAKRKTVFTDENIRKIFGSTDGESENIDRLKEYYFKTDTYEKILSNLPMRILVGNKGVGKSALFIVAMAESSEEGNMPIFLTPDDIAEIGEKHESLILSIRKLKFGLTNIIVKKALEQLGMASDGITSTIIPLGGKIFVLLKEAISNLEPKSKLSDIQKEQVAKFLNTQKLVVYLDDVDRGWQNRQEGLLMISALINSIRDLARENPGLTFKVALRSDVYIAVRTEDESSDKFEQSVVSHSYKVHDIFVLLVKRILTFWGDPFDDAIISNTPQKHLAHYLDTIFDSIFYGKGKWEKWPMYKVLLSLIRNRPRDLVKLCSMAATQAYKDKSNTISTKHIEAILPDYSKSIINDTIAEYKSELPSIERLLYGMRPDKKGRNAEDGFFYTTAEIHKKIYFLIQQGEFRFASGKIGTPETLTTFLYKISFLTATKRLEEETLRSTYEDNSNLSAAFMNLGYNWEVHLAYRWALQPDSLDDIFMKISKNEL